MIRVERFLLFRFCLFLVLLMTPVVSLGARGGDERNYREVMSASFEQIMNQMELGSLDGKGGKARLAEIRTRYRAGYTDFDGMLDALIDRVAEGRISAGEAIELLHERVSPGTSAGHSSDSGGSENRGEQNGPGGGSHGSSGGSSGNTGKGKSGS